MRSCSQPAPVVSDLVFDEDLALAVQKDVAELVEEREPELVVSFSSVAELNDCFVG